MSIPNFNEDGYLPAGIWSATLSEIELRFGLSTPKRIFLMGKLKEALSNLKRAGVKKVWINGSFISSKENPKDIDGCWEYNKNVDLKILDTAFLNPPYNLRKKFRMDFFIENFDYSDMDWKTFFQNVKEEKSKKKGIIFLNLRG